MGNDACLRQLPIAPIKVNSPPPTLIASGNMTLSALVSAASSDTGSQRVSGVTRSIVPTSTAFVLGPVTRRTGMPLRCPVTMTSAAAASEVGACALTGATSSMWSRNRAFYLSPHSLFMATVASPT